MNASFLPVQQVGVAEKLPRAFTAGQRLGARNPVANDQFTKESRRKYEVGRRYYQTVSSETEMNYTSHEFRPSALRLTAMIIFLGCMAVAPTTGWAQQSSEKALFDQARTYEGQQNYDAAAGVYRKILASDPNNAEALKRLGIVEQTELKFNESIQDFKRVLSRHPDYPQVNFFLGLSYYGLHDSKEAIASFRRELKTPTAHPATHYYLGMALEADGQTNEAIDQFNQVAVQRPNDPNVLYELARLHMNASFVAIRNLMKNHPDSFQLHMLLGDLYTKEARYPEAILQYQSALKKQPDAPGIHFPLGENYWLEDKWDLAEKEFLLALKESPTDALTNLYLGDLALRAQKVSEALPYLKQSAASDPKYVQTHILLGQCYMKLDDLQKAKAELLAAARLDPAGPRSHYLLSQVYQRLHQTAQSRHELDVFADLSRKKVAKSNALAAGQNPLGSSQGGEK